MFWFNLPVGALALAGAVLFLRPRAVRVRPTLDIWGMVFIALATTGLVLVSSWGGSTYDWSSPVILGLIGATLISAVVFVQVERHTAEPIIPMALFRDRNFKLTTAAGLLTSVAMFGSIGYMPTYLQMATGASATEAGMLMIPMMGALLVSSIVSGQLVSRTGRYKWMPIAGSVIMVVALVLMGMLEPSSAVWHICLNLGILGLGLGLNMQILVLIVQNSFPLSQVGTATAANNFFRQIGATLGSAVVGSLFASRLTGFLDERLPAQAATATGGTESLTPALVQGLPDELRQVIVNSYSEALIPLFLYMAPLAAVAAVLCLFIIEKPLATTLEHDAAPESVGEGNLVTGGRENASAST